ncbi:MAG: helix-hairpin-helix domain-containing protein [Candidatus Cloacimonetes bacterium]|nr:helix-hairpin-helix domain-containing protein [Candidatus Cloacimonadota bacterium]
MGESTKFLLLKELGSVDAVKDASVERLTEIKGIGTKSAQIIYDYFHKE